MSVFMVSIFLAFISVIGELAVRRVKRASACTYASRSNYKHNHNHYFIDKTIPMKCAINQELTVMWKIHAILMAHLIPSKHNEATS